MDKPRIRPKLLTLQPQNSSPFPPGNTNYSPVTNLTFNLKDLTTSFSTTPNRRISFSSSSNEGTPTSSRQRIQSLQDDGYAISPTVAPSTQAPSVNKFLTDEPNAPMGVSINRAKAQFAKMRALPLHFSQRFSAKEKENKPLRKISSTSSTEGSVGTPEEDCSSCDSGFSEKEDVLSVYRREFNYSDAASYQKSQLPHCQTQQNIHTIAMHVSQESPSKPKISPTKSDDDDGYDFFDTDSSEFQTALPSGFSNLLNGPLPIYKKSVNVSNTSKGVESSVTKVVLTNVDCNRESETPRGRSCSRGLFLGSNEGSKEMSKCPFKRPEPPHTDPSPIQNKRRKSLSAASCYSEKANATNENLPRKELHRSYSDSQTISLALQRSSQNPDLIGDFTKPYILPLSPGKNDLKNISPETLSHLLHGDFSDTIERYFVIDCRFPYEYDGGHIQNACNIYTKDGIIEELLHKPVQAEGDKRVVLIFHCEFSSERGPALLRFLRNKDREANKDCYPHLYFPEIYLLAGGYKAFFKSHQELCKPQAYKPMLHKDHEKDLRHFRAKSKSWHGDKRRDMMMTRTGLKS